MSATNDAELEVVYAKTHDDMLAAALRILGPDKHADAEAVAHLVVARFKALKAASDELTGFVSYENICDLGGAELAEELRQRAHKLVGVAALDTKVLAIEALEIAAHGAAQRRRQ